MAEFVLAVPYAVASVLAFSAVSKLRHIGTFVEQIADYRLVPYSIARPVALSVLAAEVISCVLLLDPKTVILGSILSSTLFFVFLLALSSAWRSGRRISCGCFGGTSQVDAVGPASLVRTSLLLTCALLSAFSVSQVRIEHFFIAALIVLLILISTEVSRLLFELSGKSRELALVLNQE